MRRIVGVSAIALVLVFAGVAPAFAVDESTSTPGPAPVEYRSDLPKPPVEEHVDAPPIEDAPSTSTVEPLDDSDASGPGTGTVTDLGGSGTGHTNRITFVAFDDGDMVVAGGRGSLTGHAGLFDSGYYSRTAGNASKAVWSANTAPFNGVQREYCSKYRGYDKTWALWVPHYQSHAVEARNYCRRHNGQPYNILSSKNSQTSWYCSKLCWAAWHWTAGIDLDADGGYWVWPMDLVYDGQVRIFGFWD